MDLLGTVSLTSKISKMWISFLLPTAFNLWDQKLLIDVMCNKNRWKLINEGSVWFQILK
jgi:hypothetical protein